MKKRLDSHHGIFAALAISIGTSGLGTVIRLYNLSGVPYP